MPARVAVFASGGGSNLQVLLDRFNRQSSPPVRVELVVGSRPGIGALQRAVAAHVPGAVLNPQVCGGPEAFADELLRELEAHGIDLVVLAGYLQMVPLAAVERFRGRMINIHPALLPAFGGHGMFGMRVHRAVLDSGARVTGATVHLVDERYDEGRILAQWPVPVLRSDTPETLAARVLRVEHLLLPAALEALVRVPEEPELVEPLAFELAGLSAPAEATLRRLNL